MKKFIFAAAISMALTGCAETPGGTEQAQQARNTEVKVLGMVIGGKPVTCIEARSLNLSMYLTKEIKGTLRSNFLKPEAAKANVRVFSADHDVTNFGSNVIYYTNEKADCLLWTETLGLQEYVEKAGLSPLGIVNGYEPAGTVIPLAKTTDKVEDKSDK